jgi:hypothetical protein
LKIFLSYRRADSQYVSDRLFAALTKAFGQDAIFKDVDSIPLGADFKRVVEKAVAECDVLLVLIGTRWLSAQDQAGNRRLDDASDLVRIEIETAVRHGLTIVPLLVENVAMPKASELPSSLAPITYRNAATIRPDPGFSHDVERLTRSLGKIVTLRAGVDSREPQLSKDNRVYGRTGLRYFCYLSRSKVAQLVSQLGPPTQAPAVDASALGAEFEYLNYVQGLAYGSGRGWGGDIDMTEPIQQLRYVLSHIVNYEKIANLNELCVKTAGKELNAFCYAYSGRFRAPDFRSREKKAPAGARALMFGHARRENEDTADRTRGGDVVRSGITELKSQCGKYTLNLACSLKYFSDMGGGGEGDEWEVHPHSGNHHFFAGNVDVWFDTLVFVNGVDKKQIYGTPLFLITGVDPDMRI